MDGISCTDYPVILDTSSMGWVAIGYLTHISLSIFQAILSGVLIVSGLHNALFKTGPSVTSFLSSCGAGTGLETPREKTIGLLQLTLGVMLLLPLLFDAGYLVSLVAAVLALLLFWVLEQRMIVRRRRRGRLFAVVYMLFAVLISGFSFYERKDNLAFGVETAFQAKTYRDAEIAWQLGSDPHSPKLGHIAPDFSLPGIDGDTQHNLSDYLHKGKPVVLFFGANSCPAFSEGTLGINRLHDKFKAEVNFVGVYVKEPHPTDEWWLTPSKFMAQLHKRADSRVAVDIQQPETFSQRLSVARRAHKNLLNSDISFLVDTPDNVVNNRWTGQPTRLYLLSEDGEILYNPGTGPYSFNPDYLEPVLMQYLAQLD